MDVQETFGQACTALLAQGQNDWRFCEIAGIYSRLHPYFAARADDSAPTQPQDPQQSAIATASAARSTCFGMLPTCSCFVHAELPLRLKGCDLCTSPFNQSAAAAYAPALFRDALMHTTLDELAAEVRWAREAAQVHFRSFFEDEFSPVVLSLVFQTNCFPKEHGKWLRFVPKTLRRPCASRSKHPCSRRTRSCAPSS